MYFRGGAYFHFLATIISHDERGKAVEEMKRGFYNIMKAEQLERINIEKERLQLEKERLEWEKQKQAERNGQMDNGESYGVVLMPPVLGGDK